MDGNLNPFRENPQAPKNKSPAWGGAFVNASRVDRYLAGALEEVAESAADFLLLLLLL